MQLEISIGLNFIISFLYNNLPRRRVNMLGEQMFEYLCIKYQDHWYPETPIKGSAYRSIRISNEKVDKIFLNSVNNLGLNLQEILFNLPNDLTIWIDPGEVSYQIGEQEYPEILYSNNNNNFLSENSESSNDNENISRPESVVSIQSFDSYPSEVYNIMDSDYFSWKNSISEPILSVQKFAETKFGSLKTKEISRKNSSKIFPNGFSAYIKQKEQFKLI